MAKAEIKTKATEVGVADFIAAVPEARRREEAAVDRRDPPPRHRAGAEDVGAVDHRLWQL